MSVTPASRIPAALDALVALLRADPELSAVDVLDGPPVSALPTPSTVLIVGGNGDEDDVVSATADLSDSSLRRGDSAEGITVRCHLEHWRGGDDLAAARTHTFAVLDAVKAALVRDPKLGGTVTRARLTGELSYAAARDGGDTGVGVPFAVRCDIA